MPCHHTKRSRQVCLSTLNGTKLLTKPATSEGAFYIFAELNTQQDDFTLAKTLIEQHGIATIPGSAFAASNGCYLRISYGALTSDTVTEGIEKLIYGLSNTLI